MRKYIIVFGLAAPVVLVAQIALMAYWLSGFGAPAIERRVPHAGERPTDDGSTETLVAVNTGTLVSGQAKPARLPGLWPQFRGPGRDASSPPGATLPAKLPGELPVLWKITVGEGHAGVAIRNGRVYIHDYDRERSEDAIRCLSLADGGEIWRWTYHVKVKRNHGMSRTVPAVTDKYLLALGPKCHVTCLDANTGERKWAIDLVREHGTTVPPWYAGQCPLIDDWGEGDTAIIAPGADPMIMAVGLESGDILWKTPNPGGWKMSHTSIMPMDYRGERQYIYAALRGVIGVRASDGAVRWRHDGWGNKISAVPSPVVIDENRVFLSGGYNAGCSMIRLKGEPGAMEIEELWRQKPNVFGSEQHTPVLHNRLLYSVIPPNTAHAGQLACIDPDGKRLWASGAQLRFGLGPYTLVGGRLLVLDDRGGDLHAFRPAGARTEHLAEWHVLDGHDAWAPIAVGGGLIIFRDLTQLVCLDISGRSTPAPAVGEGR